MDDLPPPDSPRFLYEDPQHWELEAKNKQDFIDHFMSTKFDNLHMYKAVRHDFSDMFRAAENSCRYYNMWVDNVETQELTDRFRVVESFMMNPYAMRFNTAEDPEDLEKVLLRPGDTWANIAF